MTATLTGDKELIRKLNGLSRSGAKKAARAGLNAGATPVLKAARAAVNSASPPAGSTGPGWDSLKKTARRALKKRFVKGKLDVKVGFGVGSSKSKAAKAKRMTAHERSTYGQGGAGLVRGVGISEANIHWFVLGTSERRTKKRRTGSIRPVLADVVPNATMQSAGASVEAARRKIAEVIEREARKRA